MSPARLLIGFAQRIRRPGAAISIKHMLTLSFGLLIATLAGLGGLALVRMQQIDASAQNISEAHLQGVADSLRLAELATRRHSLDYLMAMSEKDKVAEVAAQIDAIDKEIKQLSTDYEAKLTDEEKLKVFKDAEQALRHYSTLRQGVQAFVMVGGSAAAIDLITSEGARRFDDARTLLLQLSALNVQAAKEEASLSNETYLKTRRQMLILIAALVLGASLLGYLVIRSITRPLQAVVDLATHVAQGDLRPNTQAVQSSGTEIGRMNIALATMTERLREMVESVRSGVDTVKETSVRISTGNHDLSQRTEDSATRLHTTSDRMGTMAANLRQTQGSAATAASMSAAAAEQASTGGQAVQQMVHDMHAIRDAAREIGEITGVINGIAFQTNILALNAAIEAARAGEQGKGFAVVATEVRHLAQRTSTAAQEINTLIAASVSKAEVGAARAESAGKQMAAIVSGVFEVRDLMGRMQEMASEQGRHIDQVEKDMQALEQMTQSNAILVEQSAVASSVLNDQAHELARTMQQFHSLT